MSAMMNAAAPITGGMSCPPVDATASTAPATWGLYPFRFISGMLMVPVVRTFATAVPEIIPIRLDPTTDAFAGPPRLRPVAPVAMSINTRPAPECSRNAP